MLNIPIHRQILFNLIRDIYKSEVAQFLGFKGGTAAYFFDELDRFSTDLDFDLLNIEKLGKVKEEIKQILNKYGEVVDEKDKEYTLFFLLNYEKGIVNIKVEINKRNLPECTYKYKNFYGTNVLTLKKEDAFAAKLVAATARKRIAMRDFYDINFYLKKGILPNTVILEKLSNKNFVEYVELLIKYIEKNLKSTNVLYGLGEVINEKQKKWVKEELKTDLIDRLTYLKDNYK